MFIRKSVLWLTAAATLAAIPLVSLAFQAAQPPAQTPTQIARTRPATDDGASAHYRSADGASIATGAAVGPVRIGELRRVEGQSVPQSAGPAPFVLNNGKKVTSAKVGDQRRRKSWNYSIVKSTAACPKTRPR